MPNLSSEFSFNIKSWFANSAGLTLANEWQTWSKEQSWPEDATIDASNIPAMMRRRMSKISKLAVHGAIEALKENHIDYMVFASRHGELHRSVKIIQDILSGEDASPMAFSQSVHNTAGGLTTIATKKKIPMTSVAAGDNTFQSALLDAWAYLESEPNHNVLVVCFDEPLPSEYDQFETEDYQAYALSLVLSHGKEYHCGVVNTPKSNNGDTQALPQALQFLRQFIQAENNHDGSETSAWTIDSSQHCWQWNRA